ncbi:nSTAND1 domain-containing NTPase [Actinoplanes sichuanensis]|uniref:Restriction endonuclease n=1 Tax=Actinoplanes sichuanensis TaxID=512349 RepID=A0ABW4AVL7_9ACTN|nr:restriction endonuclease [Actinoplanes sichuanensis]
MQSTTVQETQVMVLAAGNTPAAAATARGHLFERFIAKVLEQFGFDQPTVRILNNTSDGIELDIAVRHRLTGRRAIAECKAYTSAIHARELTSFYGKLGAERLESSEQIDGFFFALPRLTNNGAEQARKLEKDPGFRYLDADHVAQIVRDIGIITTAPDTLTGTLISDSIILVTEHGVFSAAKRLDPSSRTTAEVVVWAAGAAPVPMPVVELLKSSPYAASSPVRDARGELLLQHIRHTESETPVIVEVRGSQSDFEYQLPASPQYFVGRRKVIAELESVISNAPATFVINAKSGWGKSSLALRLRKSILAKRGHAIVFDTRTASSREYVTAAIRSAAIRAEAAKILHLPSNASWASLASALETLRNSQWAANAGPLLIFFDQFENVFKEETITREFRDLALGIAEVGKPIVVGFAWKTDLVGWVEGHPFQLREEIRAQATVANLKELGPSEIDNLLGRLERSLDAKLLPDLKQRLREISQGLPWLFKKLAGHVLREVQDGKTQSELVSEALNVQSLFESDLAELQPIEREALLHIARYAPVPVSEVEDRLPAGAIQSLVDRRLVVQIAERLDTYWDIFRDFLTTGRIPIEESYTLRLPPSSVGRLLREVMAAGGDAPVPHLAARLATSETVIYNLARELRVFGVVTYEPNRVKFTREFYESADPEDDLRRRVTTSLRRHKAFSACAHLLEKNDGEITQSIFAAALPKAFPAIAATENTWLNYARSFAQWFHYAGLIRYRNKTIIAVDDHAIIPKQLLFTEEADTRRPEFFPQRAPGPALALVKRLAAVGSICIRGDAKTTLTSRDLLILGIAKVDKERNLTLLTKEGVDSSGNLNPIVLRALIEKVPGCKSAIDELTRNPETSTDQIGEILKDAQNATWSESWTRGVGKQMRAWAKAAGVREIGHRSVRATS